MRVALHTRLKPGKEAEYERVHAVIPRDLGVALRDAGVSRWAIYRDGLDLALIGCGSRACSAVSASA